MCISKDMEVKKNILEAAKIVFQKWGLNKTTMEDIAHEVGKGKSTLYYYYRSKEEIFEELVKKEFASIIGKAQSASEEAVSSKDKLKKYIATMLSEIKKTVGIFPLVKGDVKGNKEFVDRMKKMLNDEEEAVVLEILQQGLKSGELSFLKEDELIKAAKALVGMVTGLAVYLFFDNDDNEIIDIATRLIAEGM
jgi:AcrR family transcriptional regulator